MGEPRQRIPRDDGVELLVQHDGTHVGLDPPFAAGSASARGRSATRRHRPRSLKNPGRSGSAQSAHRHRSRDRAPPRRAAMGGSSARSIRARGRRRVARDQARARGTALRLGRLLPGSSGCRLATSHSTGRIFLMGELIDKIKGNVNEAIGKVKQESSNPDTQADGAAQGSQGQASADRWQGQGRARRRHLSHQFCRSVRKRPSRFTGRPFLRSAGSRSAWCRR